MSSAALHPETEHVILLLSKINMFCLHMHEHTLSVSYHQCLINHPRLYSRVVHCLEHLEVWRLKEHHIGQELRGPQHFERLES